MTAYGSGQLYNSKYYGLAGMESLRAVLKHANQYGLKYIFVRDRFYEPLLAFAGWRQAETYDNGNVTLWTKEDVPPAKRLEFVGFMPTEMEGILWGILPVASSLFALFLILLLPERRRVERRSRSLRQWLLNRWCCGRPGNEACITYRDYRSDGCLDSYGDNPAQWTVAGKIA